MIILAMKKPAGETTASSTEHMVSSLARFADTLWRVAVPVTVLTLFGAALDDKLASAPCFMLIGALLGFLLSIFLIRQQDQSKKSEQS